MKKIFVVLLFFLMPFNTAFGAGVGTFTASNYYFNENTNTITFTLSGFSPALTTGGNSQINVALTNCTPASCITSNPAFGNTAGGTYTLTDPMTITQTLTTMTGGTWTPASNVYINARIFSPVDTRYGSQSINYIQLTSLPTSTPTPTPTLTPTTPPSNNTPYSMNTTVQSSFSDLLYSLVYGIFIIIGVAVALVGGYWVTKKLIEVLIRWFKKFNI